MGEISINKKKHLLQNQCTQNEIKGTNYSQLREYVMSKNLLQIKQITQKISKLATNRFLRTYLILKYLYTQYSINTLKGTLPHNLVLINSNSVS